MEAYNNFIFSQSCKINPKEGLLFKILIKGATCRYYECVCCNLVFQLDICCDLDWFVRKHILSH